MDRQPAPEMQRRIARELARNRLIRDVLAAPDDELFRERLRLELARRRDRVRRMRLFAVAGVAAVFFLAFSSLLTVSVKREWPQQARTPPSNLLFSEITTAEMVRRGTALEIVSGPPRTLEIVSPRDETSVAIINTSTGERGFLIIPTVLPVLEVRSTRPGLLAVDELSDAELLAMNPGAIAIVGGEKGRRLVFVARNDSR
jgi:hypothetical protein